jgi:hypothetical protein
MLKRGLKMVDVYHAFPTDTRHYPGMELRDWFAGMILSEVGPANLFDSDEFIRQAAKNAYRLADAMMEARKE